jgi:hypothetical protein
MVTTESGNLSARYVLAVMIGALRARCPSESFVGSHCRSPMARVRRLSLQGVFGSMLIKGSSLCRQRDT